MFFVLNMVQLSNAGQHPGIGVESDLTPRKDFPEILDKEETMRLTSKRRAVRIPEQKNTIEENQETGHAQPPERSPRNQRPVRKEPPAGDPAEQFRDPAMPAASRHVEQLPIARLYIVITGDSIIRCCDSPGDAMAFTRAYGSGEIYHRSRHQIEPLSPELSPPSRRMP